jgi:uncharacterized protein YqjF (DUF2071 family)
MAQRWHDVLFLHWAVRPDALRPLVPTGLELDTRDGTAYLGVVPFRMTGVRLRWTPPLPWLSAFSELNVRTYVAREGKPGVFFFSLDAANPVAVAVARLWYHLPYFRARMSCAPEAGGIRYASRRTHARAPAAEFRGGYAPAGPAAEAAPGSLEAWLTERYCLYAADRGGRIRRGEIHHDPWPLQPARADIEVNAMATPLGLALEGPPHRLFARRLDAVFWPLR